MKSLIAVTQLHTEKGHRLVSTQCPVALAINDLLIDSARASVYKDYFIILNAVEEARESEDILIPENVGLVISDYDLTGKMLPFEFEIDIPDKYLKASGQVVSSD